MKARFQHPNDKQELVPTLENLTALPKELGKSLPNRFLASSRRSWGSEASCCGTSMQ
jgi:hypothetical protein